MPNLLKQGGDKGYNYIHVNVQYGSGDKTFNRTSCDVNLQPL